MNIIVYAISCRAGGALSVLSDFYQEAKSSADKYPDVKWIILLSSQKFEDTENIKVIRTTWAIKTWFHRWYFNKFTVNKIIRQYKVKTILSLQNMGVIGSEAHSIISLHNVLPLYKCDKSVLQAVTLRIKQRIVNQGIICSLKAADAIIVPSNWIKLDLIKKIKIADNCIHVVPLRIPKYGTFSSLEYHNKIALHYNDLVFFYPADALPYKNHKVIVNACKLLKEKGISNYQVIFTFDKNQTKTSLALYKEVLKENLNISFVGVLPRAQVFELYKTGVLIFSSKIETDAMPLIECTQSGGYLLSVDLPYAHEAIDNYSGKEYFLPDDASKLCEYMKILINEGVPKNNIWYEKPLHNEVSRLDRIIALANSYK